MWAIERVEQQGIQETWQWLVTNLVKIYIDLYNIGGDYVTWWSFALLVIQIPFSNNAELECFLKIRHAEKCQILMT
jgi:hypothetical protein